MYLERNNVFRRIHQQGILIHVLFLWYVHTKHEGIYHCCSTHVANCDDDISRFDCLCKRCICALLVSTANERMTAWHISLRIISPTSQTTPGCNFEFATISWLLPCHRHPKAIRATWSVLTMASPDTVIHKKRPYKLLLSHAQSKLIFIDSARIELRSKGKQSTPSIRVLSHTCIKQHRMHRGWM